MIVGIFVYRRLGLRPYMVPHWGNLIYMQVHWFPEGTAAEFGHIVT
jgi:hypothetical protein